MQEQYLLPSRNLAYLQIDTDANGGNAFINIAAQVSGLDIKYWSNWCRGFG